MVEGDPELPRTRAAARKQQVTTGNVRVVKHVTEIERSISKPLLHHQLMVERRIVNRVVATAPEVRTEGDTTIIPVMEEKLVVTKQLVLKEEIWITRIQHEVAGRRRVKLRSEDATIESVEDVSPGKPVR